MAGGRIRVAGTELVGDRPVAAAAEQYVRRDGIGRMLLRPDRNPTRYRAKSANQAHLAIEGTLKRLMIAKVGEGADQVDVEQARLDAKRCLDRDAGLAERAELRARSDLHIIFATFRAYIVGDGKHDFQPLALKTFSHASEAWLKRHKTWRPPRPSGIPLVQERRRAFCLRAKVKSPAA